jgi:hypothetical protein
MDVGSFRCFPRSTITVDMPYGKNTNTEGKEEEKVSFDKE